MIARRGLLGGLGLLVAAPAIIRPGILIPVKVERAEPFLELFFEDVHGVVRRFTQDKPNWFRVSPGYINGEMQTPWGALPAGYHKLNYRMKVAGMPATNKMNAGLIYSGGPIMRHTFKWGISNA